MITTSTPCCTRRSKSASLKALEVKQGEEAAQEWSVAVDGGMLVMVEVARMNLGNLFFFGGGAGFTGGR